jgi:hypothetical protein
VTQVARIYDLGMERLRLMEAQRAELGEAIADLREQMQRAKSYLARRETATAG